MRKSTTPKLDLDEAKHELKESQEQVDALYQQVKQKAGELYEDSKQTMADAQDHFKEFSDSLVKQIKEKPFTSLMIAGGIGFILSSLLKK